MNEVQRDCTGTNLTVPDGITPIRGIRVFGLDNRGRLSAARFRHYYQPGENVATCQSEDHPPFVDDGNGVHSSSRHAGKGDPAPSPTCTCGFYAWWDDDAYWNGSWKRSVEWPGMYHVIGIIDGYGRVLLGTRGYRSEKARVVAVNVKDRADDPAVERMKRLYPDVTVFANETTTSGKRKKQTTVVEGSGTRSMIEAFPLFVPGSEGDSMWEWDRG